MTTERTMTLVVTKELALDGTSAIKELKSDIIAALDRAKGESGPVPIHSVDQPAA